MKKASIFSKKFVSWLLSVSIIAGTLACLSTTTLFAATETSAEALKQGVLSKVTYDFEGDDTSSDFRWWAKGSEAGSKAQVKTDTDGNKVLSFKATAKSWMHAFANLTYELEANSKYKISYRFKAIGDTKICNSYSASGVFIGKNAPNSRDGDNPRKLPRLAVVYGGEKGDYSQYPTVWTNVTNEINTGDLVDNEYKYLAFNFCMTGGTVDSIYGEIYLDDIVIEKLDPNVGFYDFENGMDGINNLPSGDPQTEPIIESITGKYGEDTQAIKIYTHYYAYQGLAFPFELEAGATYKISYDYKSNITEEYGLHSNSGIFPYVYNPTGAPKTTRFDNFTSNNRISGTTDWKSRECTFTVTDSQVTEENKYLYIAIQGNGAKFNQYIYLDNVKIEKVSTINFVAYEGDTESANITIPSATDKVGTTVSSDRLNVPGYKIVGIYEDAERTIPFEGENFTIGSTDTTYYVKYERQTSAEFDFENGKDGINFIEVNYSTDPTVAPIKDKDGNDTNALKINISEWYYTGVIFPFELEAGATYEISYDYKCTSNNAPLLSNSGIFAGNYETPEVAKAAQRFTYFNGTDGNKKITDTAWQSFNFTFTATDTQVTGNYKYLDIAIQGNASGERYVYLDNVKIEKVSAIKFVAYEGDTVSTNITIPPATGKVGETVSSDCLNVPGYNIVGIYTDPELTKEFTETAFTIGAADTTFYVKYELPKSATFDFDNEVPEYTVKSSVNTTGGGVNVIPDPDAGNPENKVLELKGYNADNKFISVNFGYKLESNTSYEISYKYKGDGKFKVYKGVESGKYGNSGLYPSSFANNISAGWCAEDSGVYPYDSRLARFANQNNAYVPGTVWESVTTDFTTGELTDGSNYLSIVVQYCAKTGDTAENVSLYLDDIVIKKLVQVSFDTDGGEAIEPVKAGIGSNVALPTPQKLGYTFSGWYDADNKLIGNAGDEIPCPAEDKTYYAKWVKNESYEINFDDGSLGSICYTKTTPDVVNESEGSENKVLELSKKNGSTYGITLPVVLEPNTKYTVSFDYKAKLADGTTTIQLNPTSGTADAPTYGGSYIALADNTGTMQDKPLTLLLGDNLEVDDTSGDAWNTPNKISNTDWLKRTYTFTTSDLSEERFAMLRLAYYYKVNEGSSIYIDNLYIYKTPTVKFDSTGGSKVKEVTAAPYSTIKPGCPIRAGYTFKCWSVNDEYAGFDELTMPNADTTYTAEWEKVYEVGNVNADADDKIDNEDFVELKQILLGIKTENLNLADCSGDAKVDILDLVRLKKYLVNPENNALGKTVVAADKTAVSGLKLVWNEEFDEKTFEKTSFDKHQSQGDHDGISFSEDLVKLTGNGTATLEVKKNQEGTELLSSTGISTYNKMNFKYGYVEVRAKVPFNGKGEWPSLWMVSSYAKLAGEQNERTFEVDIFENMGGGGLQANVHNWGPDKNINTDDILNLVTNNTAGNYKGDKEFHTYGLLWTEGSFTFYRDGVPYASYKADRDKLPLEVEDQMTDLRMGIGFNFNDDSFSISEFEDCVYEIDYCRLYQIPSESCLLVRPAE